MANYNANHDEFEELGYEGMIEDEGSGFALLPEGDYDFTIVTLTHTGGKSLHAIVRVDAHLREEYRKRVAYLFDVCEKNGLLIDRSCRNPSRV